MATLPTNLKDDILDARVNQRRRYNMITNPDGTVEFEDVTVYSQVGSEYGAGLINETNKQINGKVDDSKIVRDLKTIGAMTQEGFIPDALALKEVNESLQNIFAGEATLLFDTYTSGTITLEDSLSNYKFIYCESHWSSSETILDSKTIPIDIFKRGYTHYIHAFLGSSSFNNSVRYAIKYIDDTTIQFTNNNTEHVRPRVYGIK